MLDCLEMLYKCLSACQGNINDFPKVDYLVEDIMAAVERQPGGCFYFSVGMVGQGGGLGLEHWDIFPLVLAV